MDLTVAALPFLYKKGEKMIIKPNDPHLVYSGRIDHENESEPVLVYAGSFIRLRFKGGSKVSVTVKNYRNCYKDSLGVILDGVQKKIILSDTSEEKTYVIADKGKDGSLRACGETAFTVEEQADRDSVMDSLLKKQTDDHHDLLIFKRMDAAHAVGFLGLEIEGEVELSDPPARPKLKMEVFGDSVSCGEVSEMVERTGQSDPEGHEGMYSNSWNADGWLTARNLDAEVHLTSQGGIALFDKTGYFNGPELDTMLGVLSCYDKTQYNPGIKLPVTDWDFSKYIPDICVIAIGQNDANPGNIMAEDYDGQKAVEWRRAYKGFVETLMYTYENCSFVLITTVLMHDPAWDKAIGEVCDSIGSERVHHFMFTRNGAATPGHPRIAEHEEMARELTEFIKRSVL